MRVLVVEDERDLAGMLVRGLDEAGFRVDTALDGLTAIRKATESDFDALVLDVMLPGADGFEVCAELRRRRVFTPILMLTARDSVEDRVEGLEGGADDYVAKPFAFAELIARLRALGRRGPIERPVILEAGGPPLDPSARAAAPGGGRRPCTPPRRRGSRGAGRLTASYLRAGLRYWSRSCAIPGRCSIAVSSARTPGMRPTSRLRTSSTSTSGPCAERSTSRSACAR